MFHQLSTLVLFALQVSVPICPFVWVNTPVACSRNHGNVLNILFSFAYSFIVFLYVYFLIFPSRSSLYLLPFWQLHCVISWNRSYKLLLKYLLGFVRPQSGRANSVLYSSGANIQVARVTEFLRWHLIFLDSGLRTCFISPFCRLEFWGVL